ncbi:hypothetical protein EAE96_007357 [Botrytis aclada]|nr:hypothetical protein EAE96_007357 [Botrytis aclada]
MPNNSRFDYDRYGSREKNAAEIAMEKEERERVFADARRKGDEAIAKLPKPYPALPDDVGANFADAMYNHPSSQTDTTPRHPTTATSRRPTTNSAKPPKHIPAAAGPSNHTGGTESEIDPDKFCEVRDGKYRCKKEGCQKYSWTHKKHFRQHWGEAHAEDRKTYQCPLAHDCSIVVFTREGDYKRHLKTDKHQEAKRRQEVNENKQKQRNK